MIADIHRPPKMTAMIFIEGLIATFGEVIAVLALLMATMVALVKRKRISAAVATVCTPLLMLAILILSQSPWTNDHIVGKRTVGTTTFMVVQRNDGGGLQMTAFLVSRR